MHMHAGIRAYLPDEARLSKILGYEHWNYLEEHATNFANFEPKRLKPKLDILRTDYIINPYTTFTRRETILIANQSITQV